MSDKLLHIALLGEKFTLKLGEKGGDLESALRLLQEQVGHTQALLEKGSQSNTTPLRVAILTGLLLAARFNEARGALKSHSTADLSVEQKKTAPTIPWDRLQKIEKKLDNFFEKELEAKEDTLQ